MQKVIKFDNVTNENIKEYNPNWPTVTGDLYRILMIAGSCSGKTNSLCNLIIYQPDIDKIYLFAKDLYKTTYPLLINKRESTGLKHLNDSKVIAKYPNDMDVIYENIEEYNPNMKLKILVVFDCVINDMLSNKKT